MKPQVLWNYIPHPDQERNEYVFVLYNETREVERILGGIYDALQMIEGLDQRRRTIEGLTCHISIFSSDKSPLSVVDFRRFYKGPLEKDGRLYTRKAGVLPGWDGLEQYVLKALSENSKKIEKAGVRAFRRKRFRRAIR